MRPAVEVHACLSLEELERCAHGTVSAEASAHLAACASCRATRDAIASDNLFLAELVEAAGPEGPDLPAIPGYELHGELHRGSQGVVFLATQVATSRTVAIKMLLQGAFSTRRQRVRFEREVELVASLRHANVVTLHDSGITSDGLLYLVMEYVDGRPLRDVAFRHRPIEAALRFMERVADAIHAAHQRGVIHRDVKPANILVDADDQPRVLDFGIAKIADVDDEPDVVTQPGEFVGTFAYAAPEQVAGDPAAIDVRTDVYALGVVLFEMLTGERPYRVAGTIADVVRTITTTPPTRLAALRPDAPRDLEILVATALRKEPGRRYQSAAALRDDLRAYLDRRPIAARADSRSYVVWKTLRRNSLAYAAALLLVVLATLYVLTMPVLYLSANAARDAKELEVTKLETTLDSIVAALAAMDRENAAEDIDGIDPFLDQLGEIVERDLDDYPAVQSSLHRGLCLALLRWNHHDDALHHARTALAQRLALHDGDHDDVAESHHNVARVLWKTAFETRLPRSADLWRTAYGIDSDELPRDAPLPPERRIELYREALEHYRASHAMRVRLHGALHEAAVRTRHHIATTHRELGRAELERGRPGAAGEQFRAAVRDYRRTAGEWRRLHGRQSEDLAMTLYGLGRCYEQQRRTSDAARAYEAAMEMIRDLAPRGADDWRVALVTSELADVLEEIGETGRAAALRSGLSGDAAGP